ncbi:unnamed protein product, partial [Amoebophrya sp. A25]
RKTGSKESTSSTTAGAKNSKVMNTAALAASSESILSRILDVDGQGKTMTAGSAKEGAAPAPEGDETTKIANLVDDKYSSNTEKANGEINVNAPPGTTLLGIAVVNNDRSTAAATTGTISTSSSPNGSERITRPPSSMSRQIKGNTRISLA